MGRQDKQICVSMQKKRIYVYRKKASANVNVTTYVKDKHLSLMEWQGQAEYFEF